MCSNLRLPNVHILMILHASLVIISNMYLHQLALRICQPDTHFSTKYQYYICIASRLKYYRTGVIVGV